MIWFDCWRACRPMMFVFRQLKRQNSTDRLQHGRRPLVHVSWYQNSTSDDDPHISWCLAAPPLRRHRPEVVLGPLCWVRLIAKVPERRHFTKRHDSPTRSVIMDYFLSRSSPNIDRFPHYSFTGAYQFLKISVSRGSVATQLRCDGMFDNDVIANFRQNVPKK